MASETPEASLQVQGAAQPATVPVEPGAISPNGRNGHRRAGLWNWVEDQFALRSLIEEYMIPVETNTIWYTLGGVLMFSLVLEILTGVALSFAYTPDAGKAYAITKGLIESPGWFWVINFHYWNAFLIFALVMIHMLRVFVTGGYRGIGAQAKQGLWFSGFVLAACTLVAFISGESIHWDEVGFAVPWHVSEVFQAFGLASAVHYGFAELRNIPTATEKLGQIYAVHISIAPILLLLFVVMHYFLIKVKGISIPFWLKASGQKAPFSKHIREWVIYGSIILGIVLLIAVFVPRDPGIAPQLVPDSPYFGATKGPGALGTKPSFPISWTHGMNVFFDEHLGINPDIWGSIVGTTLMVLALLAIPFLDRSEHEPQGWVKAFDLRQRGWAFAAMGLFWLVMIVGVIQNAVAEAG
ncbi:MAG TPA: cytochrome b N-terminal domain-containing protein [Chloroflexota bacterium]|nr:cytochrome b N-terminal domain-containing protein [Chloroflexota bacterium]